MTDRTNVEIVRRGQESAAAAAIAAGHADYPSFRHLIPDGRRRARALPHFFAATVRDAVPYDHVLATRSGDRVDAVAVWLPPGRYPWTMGRKLRAVPALLAVMTAAPRQFGNFMRYGAGIESLHHDEPHWYLVVLSVRPDRQRQGLGSRLLEPVLALADRDRDTCWLETADPANVAYYRRFGFEVVESQFAPLPSGPTLTTMRRRSRASADATHDPAAGR